MMTSGTVTSQTPHRLLLAAVLALGIPAAADAQDADGESNHDRRRQGYGRYVLLLGLHGGCIGHARRGE